MPDALALHLDLGHHGTETDPAHGVIDVAAAVAEHHWRGTELYKRVEALAEQIESDAESHGLAKWFISDQLTELLVAYDTVVRQTTRLAFGLAQTLAMPTAANFEEWLRAAEDWLNANECGARGHEWKGEARFGSGIPQKDVDGPTD